MALLAHTDVRVVITNSSLRVNGAPFKVVQDQPVGGLFQFALPLASGYTVEALTYSTDPTNGLKVITEYAIASNVPVFSSVSNTVILALTPAVATLVVPGTVVQGGRYSVLANLSTAAGRSITPLRGNWFMPLPKSTPFTGFDTRTSAISYPSTHNMTAPIVGQPGQKLYFQGVFTVKPSLLKTGETSKQWVLNTPNLTFANVSTSILAPTNVSFPAP